MRSPPISPSTLLRGEISGASFRLPKRRPIRYAPVSALQTTARSHAIHGAGVSPLRNPKSGKRRSGESQTAVATVPKSERAYGATLPRLTRSARVSWSAINASSVSTQQATASTGPTATSAASGPTKRAALHAADAPPEIAPTICAPSRAASTIRNAVSGRVPYGQINRPAANGRMKSEPIARAAIPLRCRIIVRTA